MFVCMDQNGSTPLMSAASTGHLSVVEYLVEKGVVVETKDDQVNIVISLL